MSGPASPPAQEPATSGDSLSVDPAKHGTSVERQSSKSRSIQDSSSSVDRPTKKRSFRLMPSLSSEPKHKPSSTSLHDAAEGRPHASQSQPAHKRRESSRSSSKRSRGPNNANPDGSKITTQEADDNFAGERGPGSKGTSRLFAFFRCCGSSGVDQDDEPVLPAKKAENPRPVVQGGRAATPVEKADAEAPQLKLSGNSFDEKATLGGETTQQPLSTESNANKMDEVTEDITTSTPKNQGEPELPTTAATPGPSNTMPIPSNSEISRLPSGDGGSNQSSTEQTTDPFVEKQPLQGDLPVQDSKASDTVMRDAPVEDENIEEDVSATTDEKVIPHGIPPPPPIQYATTANESETPAPPPASEKHMFLLPPIQPEFKNKKCLVLDLDETLVHRSFKVG